MTKIAIKPPETGTGTVTLTAPVTDSNVEVIIPEAGFGTAAVEADTRYAHRANNLSDLASAATARTNLGIPNHEQVTVTSGGNVGIGTSTPVTKLQVDGGIRANTTTAISSVECISNAGTLSLNSRPDINGQLIDASDGFLGVRALAAQPLFFSTNATERMRIDSAGNVGIGTSNPTSIQRIGGSGGAHIHDVYVKGVSGQSSYGVFRLSFGTSNINHGAAFVEIAMASQVSAVGTVLSLTRWKITKTASVAAVVTNISADESQTPNIVASVSDHAVTFSYRPTNNSTNYSVFTCAVSIIGSTLQTATLSELIYERL
jgi:hypothetical protein